MQEKRGTFLLVLCILSWCFIAFGFIGIFLNIFIGPGYSEEVIYKMESDPDMKEMMIRLLGENIFEDYSDDFNSMMAFNGIQLLVGAYAVHLMFYLKRMGFYFYIAYSVLPIIAVLFYTGGIMMVFNLFFSLLVGGGFVIMYWKNLSRMTE